jgi:hypothetical protein
MSVPAVACAQLAKSSPLLAAALCVAFMLGYVTLYARLVRFAWCSPIGFVFVKPTRALRRAA